MLSAQSITIKKLAKLQQKLDQQTEQMEKLEADRVKFVNNEKEKADMIAENVKLAEIKINLTNQLSTKDD